MKVSVIAALGALAISEVAAHATFQQLWTNGVDQGSSCARLPLSNSPVEAVTSSAVRCNAGPPGNVAGKCSINAGGTVIVEMHQQNGDRSCNNEAIGGAHYGPVIVYLSQVSDSSTASGDGTWFKIYENGWSKVAGSSRGDDDNWGVKDMNRCCGRVGVKIPSNIPSGDYLLRAEVIALHAASPGGGAQLYMTCYQMTITGGSGSLPGGIRFPGGYSASDPGIGVSIHGSMSSYIVPGGSVVSGGTVVQAGSMQCPATGGTGNPNPTTTRTTTGATTRTTTTSSRTTAGGTTRTTTTSSRTTGGTGTGASLWGQCGGNGWSGPTTCAQGSCVVLNPYYHQCQ